MSNPTPLSTGAYDSTANTAPLMQTQGTTSAGSAAGTNAVPPSRVADHPYPNVPDTTADQQAATAPGTGTEESKIPFKDQANGYAKKIAGTVFRNEQEKQQGEALLRGEATTADVKQGKI